MRYLPDDHRYPPPPHWEREERRNRPAGSLLTYIAVLAAGAVLWSIAREVFTAPPQPPRIVVMQNAAPPAASPANAPQAPAPSYGSGRYAQPWDPVGPNLENWGNRARTGFTPRDVFGFASRRDDGGR